MYVCAVGSGWRAPVRAYVRARARARVQSTAGSKVAGSRRITGFNNFIVYGQKLAPCPRISGHVSRASWPGTCTRGNAAHCAITYNVRSCGYSNAHCTIHFVS